MNTLSVNEFIKQFKLDTPLVGAAYPVQPFIDSLMRKVEALTEENEELKQQLAEFRGRMKTINVFVSQQIATDDGPDAMDEVNRIYDRLEELSKPP